MTLQETLTRLWPQRAVPAPIRSDHRAQIIGLIKSRMSGISLSRHAYADVLRAIYPDLRDSTTQDAQLLDCPINVWAARPLTQLVLDQLGQRRFTGLNIWCLVLEVTTLPERTVEAAGNADQIWVPTTFVRDICLANGLPASKLHVVPYYLPGPQRPRLLPETGQPWTAVVSWDGASNLNRKFVLGSIEAFKRAWPKPSQRRVALRLKTRDLRDADREAILQAIESDSRIYLDERTVDSVDEIFDGMGALLHIHRAEGYGRHVVEAMQRRVPVICTDYSGPMDWLEPANHYGVDYDLAECNVAEFRYPQGGVWAEPRIDHAAHQLHQAFHNSGTAHEARLLDMAQTAVSRHASFDTSKKAMMAALGRL